jgi:hypothetical protein
MISNYAEMYSLYIDIVDILLIETWTSAILLKSNEATIDLSANLQNIM